MGIDREEFRRKANARARQVLAERKGLREEEAGGEESGEGISMEEKKVIEAYRKWKKTRGSSMKEEGGTDGGETGDVEGSPTEVMTEKQERIARLKRKIERRRRVEQLKAKLIEKRNGKSPNNLKEQAKVLKERIVTVKSKLEALREEDAFGAAPPAPLAQPAAPTDATLGAPVDRTMEGLPGQPAANLPPEIVAEIQNIATAAQSLAQMAGVAPAPVPEMGPEVGANIPAETAGAAGSGVLTEESSRKTECNCGNCSPGEKCPECDREEDETDEMINEARRRAQARREAIKKIRNNAMSEKSYEAEDAAVVETQNFVRDALDTGGTMSSKEAAAYDVADKNKVIQQAGVKHSGPDSSMPGSASLKAAHRWTPHDLNYGGKVPDKLPKNLPESGERDWTESHIDHFLERKELNFSQLLKEGKLG